MQGLRWVGGWQKCHFWHKKRAEYAKMTGGSK